MGGPGMFGSGALPLGEELELAQALELETVWEFEAALFLRPKRVPAGFHCLGHQARTSGNLSSRGLLPSLLVARQVNQDKVQDKQQGALSRPLCYKLVWRSGSSEQDGCFWLPVAPTGYRALGCVVTRGNVVEPPLEEIMCVRRDLTSDCLRGDTILSWHPAPRPSAWRNLMFWKRGADQQQRLAQPQTAVEVWATRPQVAQGSDVCLGTFDCRCPAEASAVGEEEEGKVHLGTLNNTDYRNGGAAMPGAGQLEDILRRHAPVVRLHPEEDYLPSSVSWFFERGVLLYSRGDPPTSTPVLPPDGRNLPIDGSNDGQYWLDLPAEEPAADEVRRGNLSSAVAYVHAKPMLGGSATDVQLWLFYPFNGPVVLKLGPIASSVRLPHVGQHVCDWEHVTLRISNLDGSLAALYMGRHSCGTWYRPAELEWDSETGRPLAYASRHGHAVYPHPGENLQQPSSAADVGIRNDTAAGGPSFDTATSYEIISADYLGAEAPVEPRWLNYAREWGPTLRYPAGNELDKLLERLPSPVRRAVRRVIDALPNELSGEEGPVGPKYKNFWLGDERC